MAFERSPEYNCWQNMKARCHNPKHPKFAAYGARGITVCPRWRNSFDNFLADMGRRPTGMSSIDRKDGSRGYEPGNCRWATPRIQSENRPGFNNIIEFCGKSQSLKAWAREIGISRESLRSRLKTGWTIEAALTTPRHPRFDNFVSAQVVEES